MKNNVLSRRMFVGATLASTVFAVTPDLLISNLKKIKQNWQPNKEITLSPHAAFDLSSTLPTHVQRGGVFLIDLNLGQALPHGVHLNENGLLTVDSEIYQGISGVVFSYEEPA